MYLFPATLEIYPASIPFHQKAGYIPIKGRNHFIKGRTYLIQPNIDSLLPPYCLRCISFLPPSQSIQRQEDLKRGTQASPYAPCYDCTSKVLQEDLKPHKPIRLTYGISMAHTHTLGWKWEVTHDGPIHHWSSIPSSASNTPASPPASDTPASHTPSNTPSNTPPKTTLSAHWYVLHDGVVVPFYDP